LAEIANSDAARAWQLSFPQVTSTLVSLGWGLSSPADRVELNPRRASRKLPVENSQGRTKQPYPRESYPTPGACLVYKLVALET